MAELEAKIRTFVNEAEKDEVERGYTTIFDFPSKFSGYLIGREGNKIREMQDQFDVEVKMLDEGKIEVQGPKQRLTPAKITSSANGRSMKMRSPMSSRSRHGFTDSLWAERDKT